MKLHTPPKIKTKSYQWCLNWLSQMTIEQKSDWIREYNGLKWQFNLTIEDNNWIILQMMTDWETNIEKDWCSK